LPQQTKHDQPREKESGAKKVFDEQMTECRRAKPTSHNRPAMAVTGPSRQIMHIAAILPGNWIEKFAAMRRASSRDSLLVIERRSGWSSKEIAERLAGHVADHERLVLLDHPSQGLLPGWYRSPAKCRFSREERR
jgi:hypothetical protein